jgi:putative NADH-flavin reductase
MNLLILGATGGTGRELVQQALARGHTVTAFVREPSKVRSTHPNLHVVNGDMLDYGSVERAVQSQDAVLSALGVRVRWAIIVIVAIICQFVPKALVLSRQMAWLVEIGIPLLTLFIVARTKPILSQGTSNVVKAMEKLQVRRFVCESSLGVGDSKGQLGFFYTYVLIPLLLRSIFADKQIQESIIKASTLEWVIVRPALLTNGPQSAGKYHSWTGARPPSVRGKISRADVAHFMLNQVSESTFLHKTPALSS